MKLLSTVVLFLVSNFCFAYGPQYSEFLSESDETRQVAEELSDLTSANDQQAISGLWILTQRRCLSGAPVLDGFNPRRDTAQIRYTDSKFYYDSFVNGCHYQSKGNFELFGPFIIYKNIRSSSTCGGISFKTREQNPYKLNENLLSLFFGPFVQGPAPCPMGDSLEVNYTRSI